MSPASCPACGRALSLPPDSAGRTARCPGCRSRLRVVAAQGGLAAEILDAPATLPGPPRAADGGRSRPPKARRRAGARRPGTLPIAIAAAVLCMPTGLVALIHALLAMAARDRGDYERAGRHEVRARRWSLATILIWLVALAFYLPLVLRDV